MNINYQKDMDQLLENLSLEADSKSLMLHSCCGPCSSYVMEYLCDKINITVFFYNPNIYPLDEYNKRKEEQKKLIDEYNALGKNINYIDGDYNYSLFKDITKGYENEKEGGARCHICYKFRLEETAKMAIKHLADYFATTLTVSPYKNAKAINNIGLDIQERLGVKYLKSDFKKKNGYKRSIELSNIYNLYRQDYCGCEYSHNEAINKIK